MKTIFYVDGFNLYYGCLKNTEYKWLDVYKLFARLLKEQDPQGRLVEIKFFTAPIKASLASHGAEAHKAQSDYHRALKILYPNQDTIVEGFYSLEQGSFLKYQKPADKTQKVIVWKLEEKQTDVNIALSAYRDVAKSRADRIVFVSNDSDLEPALMAIKEDFDGKIDLGIILPIRENQGIKPSRPPNSRLSQHANWTRTHITNIELQDCQLPNSVPTHKKTIKKPNYW